jgi:precorrin-6A/cobalt-precorrin-6A reductase
VLILGGTAEAAELAGRLVAAGCAVLTSLAGRTVSPRLPAGRVRSGGFGGPDGLARFLAAERIDRLVDATHPFAARIKSNAVMAAAIAAVPLLRVSRPPWPASPGDDWRDAPSLSAGAALAARLGTRIFAPLGAQDTALLPDLAGVRWLVRSIERPSRLPLGAAWVAGRAPFLLADEIALLQRWQIEVVLAKNSGGSGARAKLDAARALALPVVLIERPTVPAAPEVASVEAALAWLLHRG